MMKKAGNLIMHQQVLNSKPYIINCSTSTYMMEVLYLQ